MIVQAVILILALLGVWVVGVRILRADNRRIASARRGYPASRVYDQDCEVS